MQAAAQGTTGLTPGAAVALLAWFTVLVIVPWLLAAAPRGEAGLRGPHGSDPGDATAGWLTSALEGRLWLGAGLVLVAIYSTLGPAAELAAALRERNLARLAAAAVIVAVLLALGLPWLRRRPGPFEVGASVGILAVYATTLIRMPTAEARTHLFEYGVVAMLIYEALAERIRHGRAVPVPAILAVTVTALLGWVDEAIQGVLPNRSYDLRDVGFNAFAAGLAVGAILFMRWARRAGGRFRSDDGR